MRSAVMSGAARALMMTNGRYPRPSANATTLKTVPFRGPASANLEQLVVLGNDWPGLLHPGCRNGRIDSANPDSAVGTGFLG